MNSTHQKKIVFLLTFAAIALYLITVWRFSVDIPYADDYDAILAFINSVAELDIKSLTLSILHQHNEHRIAFNRIIELLSFKLSGNVNFSQLIWIGNVGWFLVIGIFWRWARKKGVSLIEFCPVVITLLAFSHHELMTFAMASIQQYYQLLFCILGVYFMVSNRIYNAMFFYILGMFSGGGGVVLGPVMALYYLFSRKWKSLFICLTFIGLVTVCYFYFLEYTRSTQDLHPFEILVQPGLFSGFILGFIGSIGNINKLGLPSGILFGSMFLYFFLKKVSQLSRNEPFLLWSGLYIISVAALTAMARGGFGILYAQTTSRYTQYSLVFVAIIYLGYLLGASNLKVRKIIFWIGLGFSVILFTYWHRIGVNAIKERFVELSSGKIMYPDTPRAKEILHRAQRDKIWQLE